MGDVVEVPGVTEEDLRRAAMDAAMDAARALGQQRSKDLQPGEFTQRDWMEREGRKCQSMSGEADYQTVSRELARLVNAGILERSKEKRRDPRVGKSVWAYRYVE